jgi:hypothetical protein
MLGEKGVHSEQNDTLDRALAIARNFMFIDARGQWDAVYFDVPSHCISGL